MKFTTYTVKYVCDNCGTSNGGAKKPAGCGHCGALYSGESE